MELEQIKTQLRNYLRQRYEVPADDEDFNDDVHLFDYGYVDSFGAVDLINFVQDTFAITISENDLVAYPLNKINEIAGFAYQRRKENVNATSGC
jgi:D-alanine--poly(phosphoribitol) ligase subunit 2